MSHSTFQQPIPPHMASDVAVGYKYILGSYRPMPVHYSNVAPAGPLYPTATDMAPFMIAHLQAGRQGDVHILREDTVQEMHRQHFTNDPHLPGLVYGFMEHFQKTGGRSGTPAVVMRFTACSSCCRTMV